MFDLNDTISAVSTPPGEGGIGIVRMSGPSSLPIAKKIFVTPQGKNLNGIESHKVIFGYIKEPAAGNIIDEVMLTAMFSPKSFTREDMVEISCHGGSLPLRRILDLTLKSGARLAEPGEFTKRAFLNGRINLLQAEAVIDIIKSKSDIALESAISQLQGGLSEKIASIKNVLIEVSAEIEASIDFPEDDIELRNSLKLKERIDTALFDIRQLIDSYRYGKIYREGISVVIAGRPNVGKSSLMNALLNEERAIVTSIPGTTRDTIEEGLNINGLTIKIVDTAGIRESGEKIEQEGIKRTQKAIEGAGLIVFLLDGSEGLREEDKDLIKEIKQKNKPLIIAINKIDMGNKISSEWGEAGFLKISALKNIGLDELKSKIFDIITPPSSPLLQGGEKRGVVTPEGMVITRERHRELLSKSQDSLNKAVNAINNNLSPEFIAADMRLAIERLGEITGETYSDDVLNRIFQEFCIGK